MEALLAEYEKICNGFYEILLKENSFLKEGNLPSRDLIEQKKALLPTLESSLQELKLKKTSEEVAPFKEKIANLQQKLMKIILLDQENEKLLLKVARSNEDNAYAKKVSKERIKSLYKQ